MGEIRIGTSGYSFKDWGGVFYPAGLASQKMLPFYAEEFDTVEVNFTYYRVPSAKTMKGMAAATPAGFRFFVKAQGSFTHERDLSKKDEFLAGIAPLRDSGKLSGLLFQFPQSFRNDAANRRYVAAVAEAFPGETIAVEFRDRSWDEPPVYEFLDKNGLTFVSVDEPQVSTLFPPVARATSGLGYVRFHSRDGRKWYKGAKERYDYLYSDAELREWLPKLRAMAARARSLYVYFNNCNRGQAVENARRMKDLLRQARLWDE